MPAAYRTYFVVVGLFALWVGAWGFAAPAEVSRALPWTVPPLHARFIAAIYLAGLLAMAWSFFARTVAEVRIPVALASLWTGALLLVSLLHLGEFDFAKPQVAFWMFAYAVFPIWGAWLYFARGAAAAAEPRPRPDPALLLVAALCLLLAAALLVAPAVMVQAWPWKVSPLLASIYAGPFFAYGVCAFMLAREARPAARRIVLASMLTFTVLALVASLLHLPLFRFEGPAAWVWFAGFALAAAVLAMRLLQGPRATGA
ncbi:MAG TPA: hypothetical protein VHM00_13725 [Caldimonas sp.]|jgi:hypothetical protein|nr:hypothetical protein [Caldimonas sp.]HEX2542131.1 hypothetical protein [Caldimonas sp.]